MQYVNGYLFEAGYTSMYSQIMNISSRLDAAMRAAGFPSQSALARASGVPQPTIARILKGGGSKGPETETIKRLAAACNVTFEWLNEGIPGERPFDSNVAKAAMGQRPIPVISPIQAGRLKEISDPYAPGAGFAVEYVDESDGYSAWTFALDLDGVSMMPDFRPGDRVIIDPELAPNPGDFVAARNGHAEATFKKYRPRGIDAAGNMIFELVPLNPDYPTMRSDTEHLEIIGVMVEHRKKFRRGKS